MGDGLGAGLPNRCLAIRIGLDYSYGTNDDDEVGWTHNARLGSGGSRCGMPCVASTPSDVQPAVSPSPGDRAMEGLVSVFDPLICEHCGRPLESDDAISIIEGTCRDCRSTHESLVQPVRADQAMTHAAAGTTDVEIPLSEAVAPEMPLAGQAASGLGAIDAVAHETASPRIDNDPAAPRRVKPPSAPAVSDTGSAAAVMEAVETVARADMDPETSPQNRRRWFLPPAPPLGAEPPTHHGKRRRDLGIGIVVGLALTVATAAYFLGGYSGDSDFAITKQAPSEEATFALRVTPADAVVTLNDEPMGPADEWGSVTLPLASEADAGRQWLEVTAPGYHSVRQPLSTYLGVPEAFVELVRRPFELAVTTNPPEAEIWLDETLKGTSPLTVSMAPAAGSTLTVRKTGFAELSRRIAPPADGDRVALAFDLERLGPVLSVQSEPPGAVISVDGLTMGVAPLTLTLEAAYLGREIVLAASFKGHDTARTRVRLPNVGGDADLKTRLVLPRQMARLNVHTRPAGGRVVVAGRDFGDAPALIEFDPRETGKSVTIEASMAGTHFGRREVLIPPPGRPAAITVPLASCAQRVAFVLGLPIDVGADRFVLFDQLAEQIHRLAATQRFAIVAATDDGVENWPGDLMLEAATSEQKVRAYDRIRSVRPTGELDLDALLDAALALQPTTIWLFVEGDLDAAALARFSGRVSGQDVSINVVRTTAGPDESRLDLWAARHHGTFTILGRDPLPALALDETPGP